MFEIVSKIESLELPEVINKTFGSLRFERPKEVFSYASSGSWDEFGVRDPALLVDTRGHLVREKGALVMYYTGSHNDGRWQGSGRARSYDEGLSWFRDPVFPVLAPQEGAWDSSIATTPWVIRDDDGLYRLYYRGASAIYEDAVGLAISRDGIDFERVSDKPILSPKDFVDMPKKGMRLMGAMNVCRLLDGRYFLTFEATSVSCGRTTQIFGAVSDDAENFVPLNNGYPIFSAKQVRSWPVSRVANPRIMVLENHRIYMLTFNARDSSGLYAIGLAFSRDLKTWWEHPDNPLIMPSGSPKDNPFSGRLEGGVIVKEDFEQALERGKGPIRMFLMAIPRCGPSHKNSVIGLSRGWLNVTRSPSGVHVVSEQPGEIVILPSSAATVGEIETLSIRHSAASSFPPRIHFSTHYNNGSIQSLSMELLLESTNREGEVEFILSHEINSLFLNEGLRFRFSQGSFYVGRSWHQEKWRKRLYNRLAAFLNSSSWLLWRKIGSYKTGVWHKLRFERQGEEWIIKLNDIYWSFKAKTDDTVSDIYYMTLQSIKQLIRIRNLKVTTEAKTPEQPSLQ